MKMRKKVDIAESCSVSENLGLIFVAAWRE